MTHDHENVAVSCNFMSTPLSLDRIATIVDRFDAYRSAIDFRKLYVVVLKPFKELRICSIRQIPNKIDMVLVRSLYRFLYGWLKNNAKDDES